MDLQSYYYPAAVSAHIVSAVIWVGGMFFAYMALRPAAAKLLEMPQRLKVWRKSLANFFFWVWICVLTLLGTGYWMIFGHFGGMARVGWYVHAMQGLGIIMILIFLHAYFAAYLKMSKLVKHEDYPAANQKLASIRKLVGINLLLGIIVIIIAGGLRYLPM